MCIKNPARLLRETGKLLVQGQTDVICLRNMLTPRLLAARVVGANDALISWCSRLPAFLASLELVLMLEWDLAKELSVWLF